MTIFFSFMTFFFLLNKKKPYLCYIFNSKGRAQVLSHVHAIIYFFFLGARFFDLELHWQSLSLLSFFLIIIILPH